MLQKIQRLICWLFGHKNHSTLKKTLWGNWCISCYDCDKTILLDEKNSSDVKKYYDNIDEEVKLINEVMDEKEKSFIKVREQQRRDGKFAKQKREKNARKKTRKSQ